MTNFAPGKGGSARDPLTLASHAMPDAADLLRRSLHLDVHASRNGASVAVDVELLARNVGHRVPTGFIDRHLLLIVTALDRSGSAPAQLAGNARRCDV